MLTYKLTSRAALLATICYADVFDYPLRKRELHDWALFGASSVSQLKGVEHKNGFMFLKGRSTLIGNRRKRQPWQEEKWAIARRAAKWLSCIPTITLVGVTGGLAMNNARSEDDIDLFIVAANGTLWITRLLVTLSMEILGFRRKPRDTHVVNKVCLNMFATIRGLTVPPAEQDCFDAHEVLQMEPLWEQKGMYKKFLDANAWVKTFLPNAWNERIRRLPPVVSTTPAIVIGAFRLFEFWAKIIQILYMERHRTHEVVTDSLLRFHPKDARVWVRRKLAARLARFKIPLDIVFFAR